MSHDAAINRLRQISAARRALDAEEARLLDTLDAGDGAATAPPRDEALVGLAQAAAALNLSYDAARKAAKRAGASANVGGAAYVWRAWLARRLSEASGQLSDSRLMRDVDANDGGTNVF